MKLKQIKLAGFKSFVDPTTLELRSNLVSVVGPNGCGKSNVIDAVRWVMGESSAKNLRGESSTDVIFNGSNTRKPVGQASIELIFDNSDGTIGGEYASYAEISVRREVNRDAISNYYLNGTRCRRRDITDAFLGTGVGARSYSIIEQGMISRVIESKPEDLRGFIEEAAGISVYKKRRHDTELRMRHTAENLERLSDLREEQTKMLERLQRQSESAKKFKEFNTERELLEAQLLALRWKDYDQKLLVHSEDIRNLTVSLEEKQAGRTALTAALEKVRLEHEAQLDVHNKIQSKFYEIGSQVARNEQSLQHHKERRQQLEADDLQIKAAIADITIQRETDSDALFACEERLQDISPEYEEASATADNAEELYLDARLNLDNWNEEWEKFQEQSQEPQQEAQVHKSRIEHLDQQTRNLQDRIQRLEQEASTLDIESLAHTVATLTSEIEKLEQQTHQYKVEITELQRMMGDQRAQLQHKQEDLNTIRNHIQQAKGRESSLQALQQAALGKDDKELNNWLSKHNLANAPRLAELLTVENGWELAVETVLADYLEAVCIGDNISDLVAAINELTDGNVAIVTNCTQVVAPAHSLATKVKTDAGIGGLLQDILIADDLSAAIQLRGNLTNAQSIITKDGIWLSKNWLRVQRNKDNTRGVLAREQELQQLQSALEEFTAQAASLEDAIHAANALLQEVEVTLTSKQQVERDSSAQLRELSSKLSAAEQKLEHAKQRKHRVSIEVEEHKQHLTNNSQESAKSRTLLEVAIEAMAALSIRKEELVGRKEAIVVRERDAKRNAKELSDRLHELEIAKETVTAKYEGLQHTISRVDQQLSELHKRHQQIQQSLVNELAPAQLLQEELEELLSQRVSVEEELRAARRELETFEALMKEHDQQKNSLETAADQVKESLDKLRMERQTFEVRKETVVEQLTAAAIDLQQVLQQIPTDANEEGWTQRVESLTRKINNLGAINLAAVEELESETKRQAYLEAQFNDLQEALTTLDNAIKKIDRETRAKFQETFDKVNDNFKALFPKLFGGGRAQLDIVGDDLLNAGVTVTAQPPGKKNANIHLLSGGEKALTAVSLVFAIFQINPAPFCMLDEVDAPLDESNVVRFGNLIKEMSQTVQFVIITHNKSTMEIAHQLIGVTMKEPGVSRLVSVDVNEAVELALA